MRIASEKPAVRSADQTAKLSSVSTTRSRTSGRLIRQGGLLTADRLAGQHMEMIGDPLAKAIVAKVPDKFR
jgi:hypothetical protein